MEQTLTLHNRLEDLAQLPVFLEGLSSQCALSPEQTFNFNLALEEAATNVVLYAYPQDEDHTFTLQARVEDGVITFILSDDGKPFDPTEVPEADVTLSAEERPIGGLGIFLIRQMMDEVSYAYVDGHNCLTMRKTIV